MLNRLLNLMPMFDEDGGTIGAAAPESVPSEPAAETDLMDESDWTSAQKESDGEKAEEGQPEPEPKAQPSEPKPDTIPEKFKVKYNKQEVELTHEQLLEVAQKGLDYDRLRENRDRYMTPIERLAQQAGLPTDQFMLQLEGVIKYNAVEAKKQAFMSQGYEEDAAQYMADLAYENEMLKNGQAMQNRQQDERAQAQQALQNKISQDIADFEAKFPDVNKLPDEVAAAIKTGEPPVVAYQAYLIRENDKKLKALEQNQKNRETTAGPAKTIGAETSDPFLEGLMGG